MKKVVFLVGLFVSFCLVSCGSTAPCGLAKSKTIKKVEDKTVYVADATVE